MTHDATPTGKDREAAVTAAAARLAAAQDELVPCAPVRDLLGTTDLALAYAVQQRLADGRTAKGAVVSGRKIGLTSPAVQKQLGVDQPDFGVLFADMDVSGTEIATGGLLQPKVEAEVAFVLKADLDGEVNGPDEVRHAVDYAVAALEIVDSRVANWDITITDTIADNGSSALYVLGDKRLALDDFAPIDVVMELYADDALASQGTGAACLGDPLAALAWLARTARDLGEPLRAGQVILSGALGPMVPVTPGSVIRAELSALGTVTAAFAK
ncbi:2-keto-4-pentenoate hydratase [Actinocorallia sp. A-T 12471]|uniref:2-keto-4-pentenoate hydratase n=1 Tax=Actinocorallia sp. A-T 12471 TaxID=3089813 RepID=UPI0029CAD284|nr:fumarylacetoacetate hydrolase family protein [Actinocorallia sp. A-T 12471]MDX6744028.1 fumarylacetoacetate hydrolase family protein [Actinocorallia sp. A-T 12471]